MKTIWIVFLLIVESCNGSSFRGLQNLTPNQTTNASVRIESNSLSHASKNQNGSGTIKIISGDPLTIECTNCSKYPLQFQLTENSDVRTFGSNFTYALVEETQLCKFRFKITHTNTKAVEDRVYGIYFCPLTEDQSQLNCDKPNARVICE